MSDLPRRFLVRTWPLLLAAAVLFLTPGLLAQCKHGRIMAITPLMLQDMMLPLPVRPYALVTNAPTRERVTITYESRSGPRSIEADLYLPAQEGPRPGVVFSMGAPPLDLDEPRLVRIAEDSARAGAVMLVPFSERLDAWDVLPEEIDALVAQFKYLQSLPQVDPERVGFFGASVGGSLALVAAADPRIADEVDHVVSFGGYYDALETFGAIATQHITYGEVDEPWTPRRHARRIVAHQFIQALPDPRDRELLHQWFVEFRAQEPQALASLSPTARSSYEFLNNRDPAAVSDLIERLPAGAVEQLEYLSPSNHMENVTAELFIIHDRADEYIPYTELRRMREDLDGRPGAHLDEIRLFEHVEPRMNQQPEIIVFDTTRLLYRLYQLMLRWT